jgi:peptidoglycan/LPS O-acetylase OafA/YrhL
MIQRIQSLYLFLAAIASITLSLAVSNSWLGLQFTGSAELVVFAESVLCAFLALGALFRYKNRQQQFVVNRINLLLQLFLLGFFVYRSLNLSGGSAPEKGIGMLIPVFSIVLLVLANRAIKHDEDLVKSADRLR